MGSPGTTMKLHLFLSLFLALAVCQEREEEEDDGRDGRGEVRANTGCSLPFCKEFDFNPSTESLPTGMTWRRSGITPSTMSFVLPPRSTPSSSLRLPSTPRPTGRR